jgi:tRNA(Ile2) C34 agmatinyltransferase TiaS
MHDAISEATCPTDQERARTMPCRYCGTVMEEGSGYRATDYRCPNCRSCFNHAGRDIFCARD